MLKGKLRVQSSGGTVYLQASEPFEQTRLQLQDVESGEIILLDIAAKNDNKALEPVRLVYSGEVLSVSEKGMETGSSLPVASLDTEDKKSDCQKNAGVQCSIASGVDSLCCTKSVCPSTHC